MNEQLDRKLLTGATIGVGAVGLCCALPAMVALGTVTLSLTFGLGGVAVALAAALAFFIRRRNTACNDGARTPAGRAPHESSGHSP
jgi:hypothetical protein